MTNELQNFINTVISIDKNLNQEIEAILVSKVDDLDTNNICPIIVTENRVSNELIELVEASLNKYPFIPEWNWKEELLPARSITLWKKEV